MAQNVKPSYRHNRQEYFKRLLTLQKNGYDPLGQQRVTSIKDIFEYFKFRNDQDSNSVTQVLAIGTSNGHGDIPIIDVLTSRFQRIEYTVVEPAEDEIHRFRELVKRRQEQGGWHAAQFKFYSMTIEQYLGELETHKLSDASGFDIIHAQHCAYHFKDPGSIYQKLYELLAKGGILFNVIDVGAVSELFLMVEDFYATLKIELERHSTVSLQEIMKRRLPEAHLSVVLCRNVKVSECFKEDSEEGNAILESLVEMQNFRNTVPGEFVDKILALLKKSSLQTGGDMIFPAEEEASVFLKV
ncbi:histamine N-methyltransferase-like [Ptychodera flava]|uniref:histamine N-methyltransferase-like n=1 Tax=Ptychodera flava TaxID=63121 RepID=UPI003969D925